MNNQEIKERVFQKLKKLDEFDYTKISEYLKSSSLENLHDIKLIFYQNQFKNLEVISES